MRGIQQAEVNKGTMADELRAITEIDYILGDDSHG